MNTVARLRVILSAVATWLIVGASAAQLVADEAAGILDPVVPGVSDDVTAWALRIGAMLTAAVSMIRRHTPVPPAHRRILSHGYERPAPPA